MVDLLLGDEDGNIVVQPDGTAILVESDALSPLTPVLLVHGVDDFVPALMRLLPTGRAWPRDEGTVLRQVIASLAPIYNRLEQRAADLIVDAFPASTTFLLTDWEAGSGLPDPCAGGYQSVSQRRQSLIAKLIDTGGQSVPYIVGFAAALGYTVVVQEFRPSTCGDLLGLPLRGEAWANRWRVIVGPQDASAWDDVGHAWFGNVLVCAIARMAPAHMEYELVYTAATIGDFVPGRDALTP